MVTRSLKTEIKAHAIQRASDFYKELLMKQSNGLPLTVLESGEMYTRADPSIKLEALDAVTAPKLRTGRFAGSDQLIASLAPRSFYAERSAFKIAVIAGSQARESA